MSDDIKVDKSLDLKGLACPMPVVKAVSYTHLTLPTNREV